MEKKRELLLRAAYWAIIGGLIWLAAGLAAAYLAPFLAALVLAALWERAVAYLHRRLHLKRSFLAAVLTLLLTGGTVAGACLLLGALARQAASFLGELPLWLGRLPVLTRRIRAHLESFCSACGAESTGWPEAAADWLTAQLSGWLAALSRRCLDRLTAAAAHLPGAALFCVTTALAVYFTVSAYPAIRSFLLRQVPPSLRGKLRAVRQGALLSAGRWLRSQLVLLALTFGELLLGLGLLGIPYALLIAAVTALIDALPVFGTGVVLLPWAAICLLTEDIPRGVGLCALYAAVTLVRSIATPRLLAAGSGTSPLVSLLAMYAGFRAWGVWGMVLFPLGAMLLCELQKSGAVKLWK